MLKYLLAGTAAVVGAACFPVKSQASEWGCQVLLCLSGDWQGTPSCHPPIYKLIAAMKTPGFNWPTCPQANSSAARIDKYEDCPTGWQVINRNASDRGGLRDEANQCRIRSDKLTTPVSSTVGRFGHGAISRQVQVDIDGNLVSAEVQVIGDNRGSSVGNNFAYYIISRPLREKPWYVEYDDAKGFRQKSWFNLDLP